MIVNKIFGRPLAWKNLLNISPRISVYHFSQVRNIEEKKTYTSESVNDIDHLSNDQSVSLLSLKNLENNQDIIDGPQLLSAVKSYFRVYRKEYSNPAIGNESKLAEDNTFQKLCSIVNSNVHKLSGPEAAKITEYLDRMRVPSSSLIVQSILEHINNSLNDLSITDYNLVSNFIKKMNPTQTTIKLKKNLAHKFIVKITSDFQENSIDHISHALVYIANNYSPSKQSQLLEIFLEKLTNFKEDIPSRNLVIILEALCTMKWHPKGWVNVLQRVHNEMILKADEYNFGQVRYILFMIGEKVFTKESRYHQFYNEKLVNLLVQKLINEDVGLETGLSALKSLYYMRHKSKELLNYCCASYFERSVMSDREIKDSEGKLLTLVTGLAAARHKSIFWKDMQNVFSNNDYIMNHGHKTLAILAANLIILDFYPTCILQKIFDGTCDYSKDPYLHWTIAKIYQAIQSKPDYTGPMPAQSQIESLKKMHENFVKHRYNIALPLQKYLEECLGGPQYVISNVATKVFHYLDHVVVFNKDKHPVPINFSTSTDEAVEESNQIKYVEDLIVPPDCKMITVCLYPNHWYFRNCDEILGLHTLNQSTLEKICSVVALKTNTWFSVPVLFQYYELSEVYKFVSVAIFLTVAGLECTRLYLGYLGNLGEKVRKFCFQLSV